jgi:hypothetical protein
MITPDREFWFANKNAIESITSAAAGFPVEIHWGASVVTGVGNRDSYQIMPVEDAHGGAFWEWHLDNNEQWFETPLKAASAFVQANQRFHLQWSMVPG